MMRPGLYANDEISPSSSMSPHGAKAFCEGISAVAALSAAVLWIAAASHPVGVPGPRPYIPKDRTHPLWRQIADHHEGGPRGQVNRRFTEDCSALSGA